MRLKHTHIRTVSFSLGLTHSYISQLGLHSTVTHTEHRSSVNLSSWGMLQIAISANKTSLPSSLQLDNTQPYSWRKHHGPPRARTWVPTRWNARQLQGQFHRRMGKTHWLLRWHAQVNTHYWRNIYTGSRVWSVWPCQEALRTCHHLHEPSIENPIGNRW